MFDDDTARSPATSGEYLSSAAKNLWMGRALGQWWCARLVSIDEDRPVAALHVMPARYVRAQTGVGEPNCWWDYAVDHFVDRFTGQCDVPYEVLLELREALRHMSWSGDGETRVA